MLSLFDFNGMLWQQIDTSNVQNAFQDSRRSTLASTAILFHLNENMTGQSHIEMKHYNDFD